LLFESQNSDDLALKMNIVLNQKVTFQKDMLRKSVEKFDAKAVCFQVEEVLGLPHPI
jgi:hypothetical protein